MSNDFTALIVAAMFVSALEKPKKTEFLPRSLTNLPTGYDNVNNAIF